MTEQERLNDIFDGSFNPDLKYFEIPVEQRDIIATKFVNHYDLIFKEDKTKIEVYLEYFKFKREQALEVELYEAADLYERLIKKLLENAILLDH
jgi:hypothetical protein